MHLLMQIGYDSELFERSQKTKPSLEIGKPSALLKSIQAYLQRWRVHTPNAECFFCTGMEEM